MGELIQLPARAPKMIEAMRLEPRFRACQKAPPKEGELRPRGEAGSIAARQCDILEGLAPERPRRSLQAGKLRLFRVFKLFGRLKGQGGGPEQADWPSLRDRLHAAAARRLP